MLDTLYVTVGGYPPANESRKGVTATDGTMCKLADVTRCFAEIPVKLLKFYSTECIFKEVDEKCSSHLLLILTRKTLKMLCVDFPVPLFTC